MATQRQAHTLSNGGNTALISDYGAQVTHWHSAGHAPVLWFSSLSDLKTSPTPRAGIPICLPWFGKAPYSAVQLPPTQPWPRHSTHHPMDDGQRHNGAHPSPIRPRTNGS